MCPSLSDSGSLVCARLPVGAVTGSGPFDLVPGCQPETGGSPSDSKACYFCDIMMQVLQVPRACQMALGFGLWPRSQPAVTCQRPNLARRHD